ncbi:S41 family peptidase [Engelhardtia mirabilis]|uniref:Tricorn protease homolog n=1 Tax=Engelhardtia mirabilis TaxID=2528011 RepID=A0A518BN99_9BACT|nr:hypothetical protein Pla133_35340 [Planctomycetes bacterium Pla133]QDV02762.1 hypothetical protein Pla86_35320 [Planctomycetes bacterium Pla86]
MQFLPAPLVRAAAPAALAIASLAGAASAQIEPSAVMLRYPDVSADSIVFRYSGDLWIVDKQGGEARRLTATPAAESFPRFSPDGKTIAFVGNYDGAGDLYTLPISGGMPERATYHPSGKTLNDWHPDGEHLLYWSSEVAAMGRAPRIMKVGIDGSQPEALPVSYGTFGSIDATGEWLAYTPASREFRTWKRYQGGLAQDIWLFNLRTFESRQLTDYPGTDAQPMWSGSEVIFTSDRGPNGILNLWSIDTQSGAAQQLTFVTDFGVRFPAIGPEDVVFENGGQLYRLELATRSMVPVEVTIPGDRPNLRPERHELEDSVASVAPGPTGVRLAVEARGEIFSVPVEEGVTRNLTSSDGVAERDPAWSPDGQWLAFFSDRSGEYELTLRRIDGAAFDGSDERGQKTLTSLGPGFRSQSAWSPDSKWISFTANDGSLYLYSLETDELRTVAVNPSGNPLSSSWSKTSDWLAWSHKHSSSDLDAIYLYDVAAGTTYEVTSGMFDDSDPTFGPEGDYLYFSSARDFEPIYADLDTTWIYANMRQLVAVPLRADVENPFAPTDEAEPIESAKDDESADGADDDSDDGAAAEGTEDSDDDQDAADGADDDGGDENGDGDEDADDAPTSLTIEIDGFESRAMLLPIEAGQLRQPTGVEGGLLYIRGSRTGADDSPPNLMRFKLEDGADAEEETIAAGVGGYGVTADGKHLLLFAGGGFSVVEVAPGAKLDEPVDLSGMVSLTDPRAEWRQMLVDCWRLFRDYFYDEGMHGLDWSAVRERYVSSLGDVTSREDLHFLTGEMMAELNVGHAYNRQPPGGLLPSAPSEPVGLLGVDWDFDAEAGAYRIAAILGGGSYDLDARSPLAQPGVDARVGDYLLQVNGVPVDGSRAVYASLIGTAGRPTELLLSADPTVDDEDRRVIVEPLRSESSLRYRKWVADNRARVDELSGGRVGYIHVPDTGFDGQNELMRQFLGQQHKDALLIDERWNAGGQIPTRFIELLDRPVTNYWAIRHGEDWNWPPRGHRGPKAMLINGWSGSGGDAFPWYFRQSGLGKLIGMRTWGGLVGISGNPALIDGTEPSIPRFAFYETDGTWGVEGYGVAPDIEVIDDPTALAKGGDPQLEAGVTQLLEELESYSAPERRRPKGPDRSGSGIPGSDQ